MVTELVLEIISVIVALLFVIGLVILGEFWDMHHIHTIVCDNND